MERRHALDRNVMRFRVSGGQKVLAFIALLSFLALSFSIIVTNKSSIAESKSLTSATAPASSIIFTQRETLVYTVRLAQWLDQQIPRREVQIARALLAQRLAVVNTDGKSVGQSAPSGYLQSLFNTDSIVDGSSPGILTAKEHAQLAQLLNPEIEGLISQARLLVSEYQLAVDSQLTLSARASRNGDFITLLLLIFFMTISGGWFVWIGRTSISQYRLSRDLVLAEGRRLELLAAELAATNAVVIELESLNASKNEFISNISHELRTPLTSIIGYVDVLSANMQVDSNPQLIEIFQILDRSATILLSLVQSLLTLSQLDSPNKRDSFKPIDLLEITEDAIFILQTEIEKKDISVKLKYNPDDSFIVAGDSGLISQAFINLIANAVKFSFTAKEIEIGLTRLIREDARNMISVSIRDQGIGIPQSEISHLSERFYRASNAVSEHLPGTGLGLAIVAKVIELHGAHLRIESNLGKGTIFTIDFPEYLSPVETLIINRKLGLLAEALEAIQIDDQSLLKAKLHEFGGALGFYDFADIGGELLSLSRSLEDVEKVADPETLRLRDQLVLRMKAVLPIKETGESNV